MRGPFSPHQARSRHCCTTAQIPVPSPRLQDLYDKVPFYLCKTGDFVGAVEALLATTSQACCPACRLTPSNFQYYLKMLWTSSVPTGNQLQGADPWVFKRGKTPPVPTKLPAGVTVRSVSSVCPQAPW